MVNNDYDYNNVDIYRGTPQINMPKASRNLEPNLGIHGTDKIKPGSLKKLFNEITIETS